MTATSQARFDPVDGGITSEAPRVPAGRQAAHPLIFAGLVLLVVAAIVLFGFGGWEYYLAPLSSRVYLPQHRLTRLEDYSVPVTRELEDNEIKRTAVWSLRM